MRCERALLGRARCDAFEPCLTLGRSHSTLGDPAHSPVVNFHPLHHTGQTMKHRGLRVRGSGGTLIRVKVSPLHCVCLFAICIQVGGCGDATGSSEAPTAESNGTFESAGSGGSDVTLGSSIPSDANAESDDPSESAAGECPDPCAEQSSCGQICLTLKGRGSSCQLVPTVNDLTLPPRSVRFDCSKLQRGPDGYDFDALGHITLMGETCDALHESGPHRVTLTLACPP